MSEIKITKDSLENAILKDGQFVSGYISEEGSSIDASGYGAHAEGYALESIIAHGNGAHAEGINTYTLADGAHAEGIGSKNIIENTQWGIPVDVSFNWDYIQDLDTVSAIINVSAGGALEKSILDIGNIIYYEGTDEYREITERHDDGSVFTLDRAFSVISPSEGAPLYKISGVAYGLYSHAEGFRTNAIGYSSHASGIETIANSSAMTAIGQYNDISNNNDTLFVVGNGTDVGHRSNAFLVKKDGTAHANVNNVPDVYLGCPIGTIVMWPTDNIPSGWLLCDGQSIEYGEQYNQLKAVLGTTSVPNLQQRFPIGAEIGGVGNIINKGTLELYYSGIPENWYYIGDIKIGQFLDLTGVNSTLEHTDIYSDYCKIIDIGTNYISVIKCDSYGKTINNNTINNLFGYYSYTSSLQSTTISNIKINENEYSTALGSTGGEETHILNWKEMRGHSHAGVERTTTAFLGSGSNRVTGTANGNTGAESDPHNNIPPYIAINFIIKYK